MDGEDTQGMRTGPDWQRFQTDDPVAAREFIRTAYGARRVRLASSRGGFRYENRSLTPNGFTVERVRTTGTLRYDVTALGDVLLINSVRSGRLSVDRTRFGATVAHPGATVLVPPDGRFRAHLEDVDLDSVVLSRSGLAGYVATLHRAGIRPPELLTTTPVTSAAQSHWHLTATHVRDTMSRDLAVWGTPLVESSTRLLYAAFLSCFAHE